MLGPSTFVSLRGSLCQSLMNISYFGFARPSSGLLFLSGDQ